MFKTIKDFIASCLYHFILVVLKCIPSKKGDKHLVLIKTDEIGDYILFRNYFEIIRNSKKYKNYKITLVGNTAWKSILESYDRSFFNEIIWVDKKRFKKDLVYRFNINFKIRKLYISELINCVYSRSLLMDDGFAFVSKAKKTAMKCDDTTNRKSFMEVVDHWYYDTIISAGDNTIFDNIRNRNFVRALLEDNTIEAILNLTPNKPTFSFANYFVLFIGAGNPERKWPIEYYIDTANYIYEHYKLAPVLCGGPSEVNDAKVFSEKYSHLVYDFVGKTTLPEFAEILSKAKFLISVDTGSVHISAAVKCPVIGLFSGKFYKRFAPYPKEIFNQFYPIYPDFVDALISKNDPILYDVHRTKNDTIKLIQPEKVQDKIKTIFNVLCL